MPPESRKKLYDAVSNKFDIGSFDEFNKKMDDAASRKKFYDAVSTEFDLGDFGTFEGKVSVKKKAQPIDSATGGIGSAFGSPTFQPTKAYVPTPLMGKGVEDYQKEQKEKAQAKKDLSQRLQSQQDIYYQAQGKQSAISMYDGYQSSLKNIDDEISKNYPEAATGPRTKSGLEDFNKYNSQRQQLVSRRDQFNASSEAALRYINPIIESDIDLEIKNNGLNKFTKITNAGFEVPDEYKIDDYAKKYAQQNGVSDAGTFKKLVYDKLKSSVAFSISKPKIQKEFDVLFKNEFGVTPDKAIQKDYLDNFTEGEKIKSNLSLQVQSLNKDIKEKLDYSSKLLASEYKPKLESLSNEYKNQAALIELKIKQLNESYKSGLIPKQSYDLAFNDIKNQLTSLNSQYQESFDAVSKEFLNTQNELYSKYDKRYKRQVSEFTNMAEQQIANASSKYGKTFKMSDDLKKKYESIWNKATNKYLTKEEAIKYDLDRSFVPNNLGLQFAKNLFIGIGSGIKNISSMYDFDAGYVFGDYMENSITSSSPEIKTGLDLLDPTKLQSSVGRMLGGMAPVLGASALTAAATKNAPVALRLLATGLGNYIVETAQIGGGIKDAVFQKTGNIADANKAAKKAIDANLYLLPLYAIDGLPFLDDVTLGIKNTFTRAGVKAGLETATELPQEYFQGIFEELAMSDKPISDTFKNMTLERFENTALNVIPTTVLLGGGGTAFKGAKDEIVKIQGRSFAAKEDLFDLTKTAKKQFVYDTVLRRGDVFAKAYVSSLFNSGNINEQELESFSKMIDDSVKVMEESKKIGLNKVQSKVYSALKLDYIESKNEFDSEQDEVSKKIYKAKMDSAEKSLNDFISGKKPDAVVLTLANNEQYIYSFETINSIIDEGGDLLNQIIDGDVTIGLLTDKNNPKAKALSDKLNKIKKENAVQEPSTTTEVSPVTEGGQVVQEGGEGVGPSIQGTEAPQEAPIQEPTAEIIPEEEVAVEPAPIEVVEEPVVEEALVVNEEVERLQSDLFRTEIELEDAELEIENEKQNLKEEKARIKQAIADVRKSNLSREEKEDKIEDLKYELEDFMDEHDSLVENYRYDIQDAKKEIAKINKKLNKISQAPVAQTKAKSKGVSTKNKSQLDDLKSRATNAVKSGVIKAAERAINTLKSVFPEFDIVIHENEDSYNSSVSEVGGQANTRGNIYYTKNADGTYSGRIDINLNKANERTVAHEVAHAVLLKLFGENTKLFKDFRFKISKILTSSRNKELVKFANLYGTDVKAEEYLVELTAILAQEQDNISPSVLQQIAVYINDLVSKLTNGTVKLFEDVKDTKDIIDFFNTVSGAIREGAEISESDIKAIQEGASINIGDPTTINKSQKGEAIEFPESPLPLSFVTGKDKVDIRALINEIVEKKQKVWFWMADQLGRGEYYDAVIDGKHYLDAGPSFALDPENRNKGILWASGLAKKTLQDKINSSDYIFFISGSPEKAKLFNKRVLDLFAERINKTSSFGKFKETINKFRTETNELKTIKKALNAVKSFDELSNSTKRKEFLISVDKVSKNKTMPEGSLKELLNNFNALIDYNELRDGFYKENGFTQNDIMLIGKPTGLGGKAPHSTYENAIMGEVIGVPDIKMNSWDIMPDALKEEYSKGFKFIDKKTGKEKVRGNVSVAQKAKVIAAETGKVRELEGETPINKSQMIDEQVSSHNEYEGSTYSLREGNLIGKPAASVSIFNERRMPVESKNITTKILSKFINKNSDLYKGNEDVLAVGTWWDSEAGVTVIDVVAALPKKDAMQLGKDYNQKSVFDLELLEEIPTGGTDEVIEGLKPEIERVEDIRKILGKSKSQKIEGEEQAPQKGGPLARVRQAIEKSRKAKSGVGPVSKPVEFEEAEIVPIDTGKEFLFDTLGAPARNIEKQNQLSKGAGSLFNKLKRAAIDTKYDIAKALTKSKTPIGDIARAAMRNAKGYTGASSLVIKLVNSQIFDKLSFAPNVKLIVSDKGKLIETTRSERQLFDAFLDANRIINIDARIRDKFSELVSLSRELKNGIKNESLTKDEQDELVNKISQLKDYLLRRKALDVKGPDGQAQMIGYQDPNFVYTDKLINLLKEDYAPIQYTHTNGATMKDAEQGLAEMKEQLPELYKKFDKMSSDYYDTFRYLLDESYKNGLITKETYDELWAYNYIPTKFIQHFIEGELAIDNPSKAKKLSASLKNLTGGSEEDVITNYQYIMELYSHATYRRIFDNRAAVKLAQAIGKIDPNRFGKDSQFFIQKPNGKDKNGNPTYSDPARGYDYIKFMVDGVENRIIAPKQFVDIWYDSEFQSSPWLDSTVNFLNKLSLIEFIKGVFTKYSPVFGVTQILLDAPQALISTKAYPDFFLGSILLAKDYATVAKDVMSIVRDGKPTKFFVEAVQAGVFSDFLSTENDLIRGEKFTNYDGTDNVKNKIKYLASRVNRGVDKTLESIAKVNEAVEYSTRLAVYYRMKQNLISKFKKDNNGAEPVGQDLENIELLSAEQARNVVDFSVSGGVTKQANRLFAYLNSAIQVFVSAARGLKNNPWKAGLMMMEIGAAGAGILAYSLGDLSGEDDEEKKKRYKEYRKRSTYEKESYFLVWTGNPEKPFLRIPKPPLFKGLINLFEQAYLHASRGEEFNQDKMWSAFKRDIPFGNPLAELTRNPMINAAFKYFNNYDQFREENIVKDEEKILDYAETKGATELYKKIGKASKDLGFKEGVSPKKLQEAVRSFTGDPSKNTWASLFDMGSKGAVALATGDTKELEENFSGNLYADIFKNSGLEGKLFTKKIDYDASFAEQLEEDEKDEYTKKYVIRADVNEIRKNSKDIKTAVKSIYEYLKPKVESKDIDPDYADRVIKQQFKLFSLKDAPEFYDDVVYAKDNDTKAKILNYYLSDMSNEEAGKIIKDMLSSNLISREAAVKTVELRETKKK